MIFNDLPEGLSRKEREKEFHKQSILNAALEVLKNNSYAEATMNKIAEKSELSKAALYLVFPSKRYLLGDLLVRVFDINIRQFEEMLFSETTWDKQLDMFIRTHLSYGIENHGEFLNMMWDIFHSEQSDVPKEMVKQYKEIRVKLLHILEGILTRAHKEENLSFDPAFMAVFILASLDALHQYAEMSVLKKPLIEYTDDIRALILKK
jgi:AcrR family transcriptional regulator